MSDSEVSRRSRKASYSDDSFHSDDDSVRELRHATQKTSKYPGKSHSNAASSRNSSRNSVTQHGGASGTSNAARRMLSAGRVKINELRNKVSELTVQLANVQTENKQLLRQLKQQERQLERYEHEENDAPAVIHRVTEEANALREQLRRSKEKLDEKSRKLQEVSEELERTRRLLKKMKTLVDDKKLREREDLQQKLENAELELAKKDQAITDLQRHIDNLNKNHKHEIGIERARHRETKRQFEDLQAADNRLQSQLREKEKELEVRNIYALHAGRYQKPPHRLVSSINSSPVPEASNFSSKTKLQDINPRRSSEFEDANRTQAVEGYQRKANLRERLDHVGSDDEKKRHNSADSYQTDQYMNQRREHDEEKRRQREELERLKEKERQEKEEHARLERSRIERENKEKLEKERKLQDDASRKQNLEEEQERLRQRELLLAKMKAIDEGKYSSPGTSTDVSANKRQDNPADDFGLSFGDYRPSFLADVGSASTANKKQSDKKAHVNNRQNDELFLEDNPVRADNNRRHSPDFGLLNNSRYSPTVDDVGKRNGGLLPRRGRQSVVSVAQPKETSVIDDLADDIEEMTL